MRRVGLALLLLLAVAGCGLGVQSKPEVLEDATLPPEFPATTQPTTQAEAQVYFLDANDHLVAVDIPVRALDPEAVLDALLAGPDDASLRRGLRSAIPPGTAARATRQRGGVVAVDLSPTFTAATGQEQILAFAQLVYTTTALSGVDAVTFRVAGETVDVPAADGTLTGQSVTRSEYAELVAPTTPG